MKSCLRLLLRVLTLALLPTWLLIPPLCLFIVAWEYAWKARLPMKTVGQQEAKNLTLREHLVEWVNSTPGEWELGFEIAQAVQHALEYFCDIHTTQEVLAKELRKAQRKGEIRKRIRPGTKYVEYTAIPKDSC